jgi:multicomponent Na+:H+ antiporter subunit C
VLFGIAIFQMLRRNVIRSAIGVILLGNAINLFLFSTGAYNGSGYNYFYTATSPILQH